MLQYDTTNQFDVVSFNKVYNSFFQIIKSSTDVYFNCTFVKKRFNGLHLDRKTLFSIIPFAMFKECEIQKMHYYNVVTSQQIVSNVKDGKFWKHIVTVYSHHNPFFLSPSYFYFLHGIVITFYAEHCCQVVKIIIFKINVIQCL